VNFFEENYLKILGDHIWDLLKKLQKRWNSMAPM